MGDENYQKILDRIARSSGVEKDELERRVAAKRTKLSGLISLEGAAQIVAAELGISFDNEKLKIDELSPGMRKVTVIGKIIRLFPVREYTTKKGEKGKVANMIVADDTSNIKVVLWDTNHIEKVEKGEIKEEDVIEIVNGGVREGEIHLGSFSEMKKSAESLENVKTERIVKKKLVKDFVLGDNVSVRAFVVQSFEPRFFNVCDQCKRKATSEGDGFTCAEHGKVTAEKRALINIVLDDGSETTRAVVFHDVLPDLGLKDLEDTEKLISQREDLLGKELVFSGNVRMNKFFNNPEFIINEVKTVNLDELMKELEN